MTAPIRLIALGLVLSVLNAAAAQDRVIIIDDDTYAAVAYSSKTGKYGYAYNYRSRAAAERAALERCKADDARIAGWVNFGWLVVAIGEDGVYGTGYEYGRGARLGDARERAEAELKKRGGKLKTLIVLCSGDHDPLVITYK